MSKYSGMIGFVRNYEKEPGIWEDEVTEKKYTGDILKNNQRFSVGSTITGDVKITNVFSIMGNKYAFDHVSDIRYLEWRGNRWVVESIELNYPRLEMTIGGIYNGPQTTTTNNP
jgi:hypothetical protein